MNHVLTSGPVWYLMRASGVVSLLLLTAVSALGVATASRLRPGRAPRFVTLGLHRNIALMAVVFLTVHVLTAIIDPQASVRAVAAVVPMPSDRYALWLGLGALALDLVIALVVTSLLRQRLAPRVWRTLHFLAYLAWPVALLHGAGMGTDSTCDLDAGSRRRVRRGLRRSRRAPPPDDCASGDQAPLATAPASRAMSVAGRTRPRSETLPRLLPPQRPRLVARRAHRTLRPPALPARRVRDSHLRGRGERPARTRRRRIPDARQAPFRRGRARADRGRERRRGGACEPQGQPVDARQPPPGARRRRRCSRSRRRPADHGRRRPRSNQRVCEPRRCGGRAHPSPPP